MLVLSKDKFLESSDFTFGTKTFLTNPGGRPYPHAHDFIEIVFISEGHANHCYEGNQWPVNKGDILIIPPYTAHEYKVDGPSPLEVWNIMFLPSLIDQEIRVFSRHSPSGEFAMTPFSEGKSPYEIYFKLTTMESLSFRQKWQQIMHEYNRKETGYQMSIKALLIELLVSLHRLANKGNSSESSARFPDHPIIRNICAHLEQNYEQQTTVEQICQMFYISPSSLRDKFKHVTGRSFTEYRNEVRIRQSLRLLRETNDLIIDVAQNVGINDLSYFNKLFKHYTGLTPGKYRTASYEGRANDVPQPKFRQI